MKKEFRLTDLENVVKDFLDLISGLTPQEKGIVLGFSGNLGAGKTTFTKELLKKLGHQGNVVSPTFVLRRDYDIPLASLKRGIVQKLIHIDAYRLEKPEQIYQVISREELGDKNNLVIVEWPEKVFEGGVGENIFDEIYLFEHVDENTRRITDK